MLVPTSFNAKANLTNYVSVPLDTLDLGLNSNDKGGGVIGHGRTFSNRLIVDSFVKSMRSVYGISWENIQATVRESKSLPILLVSDQLTFIIAPVIPPKDTIWQSEKYHPPN